MKRNERRHHNQQMIQVGADERLWNEEHVHHEFMRLCLHDIYNLEPYYGMLGSCAAPSTSWFHFTLWPTNNSAPGRLLFGKSASSRMPALTTTAPGNDPPVRKSVVPQSGQKWDVIFLPESAVLEISFGLPVKWLDIYRGSKGRHMYRTQA